MSEMDIGDSGGEVKSSTWSRIWEAPMSNGFAFELRAGMEKLRGTINGEARSRDAILDASFGLLLEGGCSWFLTAKGAEWAIEEEFRVFSAILSGGLGSSWSSVILGEDTGAGEALYDTFADVDSWETGIRESKPLGSSLLVRGPLVDTIGLLGIGPE